MKRFFALGLTLILLCWAMPSSLTGYTVTGSKWPQPATVFYVDITDPGANCNAAFADAASRWSTATIFQYQIVNSFWDPCSNPNTVPVSNGAKFSNTDCGTAFGAATLAVTHTWSGGGIIVQSGIVFNSAKTWGVYNGPYQSGNADFTRIAVHELGHALGLSHESVQPAIMAPAVTVGSTIEIPQADDKNGVVAIYGSSSDSTPPVVTITSPTTFTTYSTAASTITLAGNGSDNIGVTLVSWSSNRGGFGNCTHTGTTLISWTCSSIGLLLGSNVLTVTARDAVGNFATDILTVTTSSSDGQAPTVTILSPTSAPTYTTGTSPINLSGTGSDNVAITGLTWSNDRGSSGSCSFSGTPTVNWNCSNISIFAGVNVLTVTANDASSNTGSDSLTVTLNVAPLISGVQSAPGSAGAASITWTTDLPSDSQIEFGITSSYGQNSTLDSSLITSHAANISGLNPNTTYHYRVKSRGATGTLATSQDFTLSTFSIANFGGISRSTDGLGTTLVTGYGRIQPGTSSTTPSGVAIFSYRQAGILISEAGVPDSPLVSSGRTFAEVAANGVVNTGVAFVNPNSTTVRVFFDLRDKNGVIVRTGYRDLLPNEHSSGFLDQAPYFSGYNFQGTFSFTATLPIAAIALRGFYNERTPSEFLMSTLPIIDLATGSLAGNQVIPHFAAGNGSTTQILLVNPTGTAQTGTIEFRDNTGAPQSVTIDGSIGNGTSYALAANGAARFVITGDPAVLASGSVRVVPSAGGPAPTPLVVFSYKQAGITVTEASVPVTMGSTFRMYVELSPASLINSGIAIANTSAIGGVATLSVTRLDGSSVVSTNVNLGPSQQIVGFLDTLIPSLTGQFHRKGFQKRCHRE